jgi:beta-lactam-binding protein with PASTA domain
MVEMSADPVMPAVWHLTPAEARAALEQLGLRPRLHFAQSRAVPTGELISVSPPPGTTLLADTPVTVTVSSGPPVVPPDDEIPT